MIDRDKVIEEIVAHQIEILSIEDLLEYTKLKMKDELEDKDITELLEIKSELSE